MAVYIPLKKLSNIPIPAHWFALMQTARWSIILSIGTVCRVCSNAMSYIICPTDMYSFIQNVVPLRKSGFFSASDRFVSISCHLFLECPGLSVLKRHPQSSCSSFFKPTMCSTEALFCTVGNDWSMDVSQRCAVAYAHIRNTHSRRIFIACWSAQQPNLDFWWAQCVSMLIQAGTKKPMFSFKYIYNNVLSKAPAHFNWTMRSLMRSTIIRSQFQTDHEQSIVSSSTELL